MKLRILFVGAAAEFSISDSARGYYNALRGQGHDVELYSLSARIKYHVLALQQSRTPEVAEDVQLVMRMASEGIVVEALRHKADLIIASSGLGLHPDGLELCNRAGFPVAVIFTESPYDDDQQVVFARHAGHCFTNDLYSAEKYGWTYLGSAWDPLVHYPHGDGANDGWRSPDDVADVIFVGTGWKERQELLEGVDWSGIKLRAFGWWDGVEEGSPLAPYVRQVCIDNEETAWLYSLAKVAVVHHRGSDVARSLGPRSYEVAACGCFQVSDWRDELPEVFGDTVPVYRSSQELEEIIRSALANDRGRRGLAHAQMRKLLVGRHSFATRAADLMAAITGQAEEAARL